MSKQTIETFFAGKNLVVPSYQRDYAWRERNIKELFADVEEALDVGGHYLGTFILSQKAAGEPVYVVDGQQRLTTLTMLMGALIDVVENEGVRLLMHSTYIYHPLTGHKFQVLGENKVFFEEMLAKKNPKAMSAGQTRLAVAYEHIRLRVHDLVNQGGQPLVLKWLTALTKMEVLEFIEPDEGKAIRMFQTVNDRGVPLAKMDIVKSLLVYYSNRYLGGVPRMLWEEEGRLRAKLQLPEADIAELVELNASGLSIEHILPQKPAFGVEHYGFDDLDQYEDYKHRLGNLLLLEASVNSACQNRTVEEKVTLPSLYLSSEIKTVRALAAKRSGAIQGYRRESIEERGERLAQLMQERWPIVRSREAETTSEEQAVT